MSRSYNILFKILRLIAQDYCYTSIDPRDKLFKMAMKINPLDFKKGKSYERYNKELLAWRVVTEILNAK